MLNLRKLAWAIKRVFLAVSVFTPAEVDVDLCVAICRGDYNVARLGPSPEGLAEYGPERRRKRERQVR